MDLKIVCGEFIGTFILIFAILQSSGNALIIAAGFLAAISIAGSLSGGHINPVVSFVSMLNNGITSAQIPTYFISQIAGGMCAYYLYKSIQ